VGAPKIGREITGQAIELRAQERSFHPVRDYLDGLKWDGVERLELWLPRYMGAEESLCTRRAGRMLFIAAIARVYAPGSKADYVVVFSDTGRSRLVTDRCCGVSGSDRIEDRSWPNLALEPPTALPAKPALQYTTGTRPSATSVK
jgi:hypothetical protein